MLLPLNTCMQHTNQTASEEQRQLNVKGSMVA